MTIVIGNKTMNATKYAADKLLAVVSGFVRQGIYAVRKGNYIELKNQTFSSKNALMKEVQKYNRLGFTVLWNW